ncbi:MAG: hypothetical protein A4S09_14915 [Proteobacteria bacterium SG_bin7]|nr:MAG: hypothetical protein A4S09_14915 [Proteobacteria bacterium SG_bin7]
MKTVVLIGSGHAHLEVLKALTNEEIAKNKFILISPSRQTYYSGLIPRLIAGEIEDRNLTINSADFAESKGFKFIQDEVLSVDQINKMVTLKSGEKIDFDLLSINVGGTPTKIPSDAPFNTIYLRPFDEFMSKWREVQRICSACIKPRFVVVGGGAGAVEVAAALRIRLNKNQAKGSEVHLISKGPKLCESYSDKISEQIKQSLLKSGIKIHLGESVNQIYQKTLKLSHGGNLKFDSIFIVTPTQPSEIFPGKVDSRLRLSSIMFAAGDGAEMAGYPNLPRSGVIAVHQGRHLVHSIRNVLNGLEPTVFKIKTKQLNILITGENSARLVWGNFSFEGKWALRLKNWIDQRYMSGFETAL